MDLTGCRQQLLGQYGRHDRGQVAFERMNWKFRHWIKTNLFGGEIADTLFSCKGLYLFTQDLVLSASLFWVNDSGPGMLGF